MEIIKKKGLDKKIVDQVKNNKREFLKFLKGYSVIQLAVGVVVGGAAKDLVAAIATNLIMPLVSLVTPGGNWREWTISLGEAVFNIGEVFSSLLNFVIVALVVFVAINKLFKMEVGKK